MNEWSSGQLWDNMAVVIGRANLDEENLKKFCQNGTNVDQRIRDADAVRVSM